MNTKSYYIIFYNGYDKVCGTEKRAKDKEEAIMMAEFSIMAHYPNVEYTHCKVISEAP